MKMGLTVAPISLKPANEYVRQHHRHNGPTRGNRFSLAAMDGDRLCGVAICCRPVSRVLDDGLTLEIARVCTDGTRNACSLLYGACARVARAMGYRQVITYSLMSENGASLKASGYQVDEENCGHAKNDWQNRDNRAEQLCFLEKKRRWIKRF